MINLSSCTAAQLPLILCMVSKDSDFGVGGNEKFLQKRIFYSWTQISPIWTRKLSSIWIYTKLIYGTVFQIWSNLCRKVAPRENPKKQTKKWNFLISASKYQKYTKFTSRYMFLWMTNAMQLVKISLRITKDVKIQDGRQLWLKKSFSVSGKQQDTQIVKFNSHPYTLSLQYPSYSKFSQLSYVSGCSHAFWCRECATWHWNKYVLFLLNFISYTYPKIYCCCRHKKL